MVVMNMQKNAQETKIPWSPRKMDLHFSLQPTFEIICTVNSCRTSLVSSMRSGTPLAITKHRIFGIILEIYGANTHLLSVRLNDRLKDRVWSYNNAAIHRVFPTNIHNLPA
jgi:hypothetical protein